MDLEARLRASILADRRSQYAVGQDAGVDSGVLSRFMRGERTITLPVADRLCRVLGLELVQKPRL